MSGRAAGGAGRAAPQFLLPREARVAGEAPGGFQLAVHVEDSLRPGALVEIVDVLRHDQQLPRPFGIEPRERAMRLVGLDRRQLSPPRIVEGLDQSRIAPESFGRADILDPMSLPQAFRPAKSGKPALGRDPGAGEDDDVADVAHAHS